MQKKKTRTLESFIGKEVQTVAEEEHNHSLVGQNWRLEAAVERTYFDCQADPMAEVQIQVVVVAVAVLQSHCHRWVAGRFDMAGPEAVVG